MEANIIVKKGDSEQKFTTNGYVLIYLDGSEIKFTGSMDIKALAPLLMSSVLSKYTNK